MQKGILKETYLRPLLIKKKEKRKFGSVSIQFKFSLSLWELNFDVEDSNPSSNSLHVKNTKFWVNFQI